MKYIFKTFRKHGFKHSASTFAETSHFEINSIIIGEIGLKIINYSIVSKRNNLFIISTFLHEIHSISSSSRLVLTAVMKEKQDIKEYMVDIYMRSNCQIQPGAQHDTSDQ